MTSSQSFGRLLCPSQTYTTPPTSCSVLVTSLSAISDPLTFFPSSTNIRAIAEVPIPPIPMKCTDLTFEESITFKTWHAFQHICPLHHRLFLNYYHSADTFVFLCL